MLFYVQEKARLGKMSGQNVYSVHNFFPGLFCALCNDSVPPRHSEPVRALAWESVSPVPAKRVRIATPLLFAFAKSADWFTMTGGRKRGTYFAMTGVPVISRGAPPPGRRAGG